MALGNMSYNKFSQLHGGRRTAALAGRFRAAKGMQVTPEMENAVVAEARARNASRMARKPQAAPAVEGRAPLAPKVGDRTQPGTTPLANDVKQGIEWRGAGQSGGTDRDYWQGLPQTGNPIEPMPQIQNGMLGPPDRPGMPGTSPIDKLRALTAARLGGLKQRARTPSPAKKPPAPKNTKGKKSLH